MNDQQDFDWPEAAVVPPKKRGPMISLTMFLGCMGCSFVSLIFLVIFAQVLSQTGMSKQNELCISHLHNLSAATLLYAKDNNETLPTGKWMDLISKYNIDDLDLSCPVQRRIDPATYGYALAAEVAAKRLDSVGEKSIMLFDSKPVGRNAIAPRNDTPVPGRHNNGRANTVALADGSVMEKPVSGR